MLTRLIYASAATGAVDPEVVQAILESARSFNLKHEITGMLCEGSGKFIQYLEGERQAVNDLYARLLADSRHKNLVLLDYAPIDERAYKDWSMGFVSVRNDDVMRLIEKSTQIRQFLPEELNAWQANSLINALKSQLYPQVALTGGNVMDIKGAKLH
jgi:hypothetical protein